MSWPNHFRQQFRKKRTDSSMRFRVISLYPIGTLLASLFAPVAAVEWSSFTIEVHDTSIYFLFAAYSISRAAFGSYDSTGFGPVSLETLLATIAVAVAVRSMIVVIAVAVTLRTVSPRVAVLVLLAIMIVEVLLLVAILLQPTTPWFSILSAVPIPAASALSVLMCAVLTVRPSLFDCVIDSGQRHEWDLS